MAGSGLSGNPNVVEDTKGKQTGPKTPGGKLRCSLNASKNLEQSKEIDKAIEELGIEFNKAGEALTLKKEFSKWFLSMMGKELTEIAKLEEIINFYETDTAMRVVGKLKKGVPLDDSDLKALKQHKEALEALHKLKFGTKQVNIHGDFDDIRELMFGEDDNPRSQ